jgi:hypothetical protein
MISDGYDATKVTADFLKTVCAVLQKDKGIVNRSLLLLSRSLCRSLLTRVHRALKGQRV